MAVIGTTRIYAVLRSETGNVSLVPFDWLTPGEQRELIEFEALRPYPPQLERSSNELRAALLLDNGSRTHSTREG